MKNKKVTSAKKQEEEKVNFEVVFTTDCRTVRELAMFTIGFIFASEFGALPKVAIILLVDKLADMQIIEFTRDERETAVNEVVNQYARNTKKMLGVSNKTVSNKDKTIPAVTPEKPIEAEVTVNGKPIAVVETEADEASNLKMVQENPRSILIIDNPTDEMVRVACNSSAGSSIVEFVFKNRYRKYNNMSQLQPSEEVSKRMKKLVTMIASDDALVQELIEKLKRTEDGEKEWKLIAKNPMMLLTIPDPTDKMVEFACLSDVNVASIALNHPTNYENIVMKIMDSETIINFLEANGKLALLDKKSKSDNKQEQYELKRFPKTKQEEKTDTVAILREEPKPIHQDLIVLLENMADKKEEELTAEDLSGLKQFMGNINVYINLEAYKNACKIFGKLVRYNRVRLLLESIADQRLKNPTVTKAKTTPPKKSPIPKKVSDAIGSVKSCGVNCRVCARIRDLSKTIKPVSADLVLVRYFMRDSVSFALMHGHETAEIFHTLLNNEKFNLEVSQLITKESKNDLFPITSVNLTNA